MLSKEEIRQKRKEAYQNAKAKRDADPRYQALKEKVNQDRKAKYRAFQYQKKKASRMPKKRSEQRKMQR